MTSRYARFASVLACCLLALICFWPRLRTSESMPAAPQGVQAVPTAGAVLTQPIESIRCGQRVLAQLPPGVSAVDEPEPEARTWRSLEVELVAEDGHRIEVRLLRPQAWLAENGVDHAGEFPLRIDELGVEGVAAVLRIGPCPPIASGAGQVVTGTFRHHAAHLIDVHIVGSPQAITCTSGHPIWSEDRRAFVAAASLSSGEQVRLHSEGLAHVRFQQSHPGSADVFNLEVNQHHVYHVGLSGLLVHNTAANCDDPDKNRSHAINEMLENGELNVTSSSRAGVSRVPRHHLFAQRLFGTNAQTKTWFEDRGIDIDKITVDITQGEHEAIHRWVGNEGWNGTLRKRLLRSEAKLGRKLSAREIWQTGYRLLREADIRNVTFRPY